MLPGFQVNRLLPFSAALLLLSYSLLGWHWRMNEAALMTVWPLIYERFWFWVMPCGVVLGLGAIASGLLGPRTMEDWFDSDWVMFFTVFLGCCLGILMMLHLAVVVELWLLLCAMLLFQLDLRAAGLTQARVYVALCIVALVGMAIGGGVHWGLEMYWPEMLNHG